mgnify:CR=1 FL=1
MKILFGGTFDPIHIGHIQLARYVSQQFKHPVSLLPLTGVPNYKQPPQASLQQRLAMLEIVAAKYPDEIKIDYSETQLTEYSPTVTTLRRMRQNELTPEIIYFVIGGDSLVTLDIWDEWRDLLKLTNFIVAMRPDYPLSKMSPQLAQELLPRINTTTSAINAVGEIIITHFTPLEVSSTQIRQFCYLGQEINQLVEAEINHYITQNNLYKGK